jgi:hypothetical protein
MSSSAFPVPWGEFRGRSHLTNPWQEIHESPPSGPPLTVLVYYTRVAHHDTPGCRSVAVQLEPLAFSGGNLVAKSWAEVESILQREIPSRDRVWGFLPKCA